MSMNAAPEIAFSSEQGKANYAAARRQYPAQAIVNLKTMRDNMPTWSPWSAARTPARR